MSFSLTRPPTVVSGASLPLSFGTTIDAYLGAAPDVWEVTATGLRVFAAARLPRCLHAATDESL
jgi:hypothetical protein